MCLLCLVLPDIAHLAALLIMLNIDSLLVCSLAHGHAGPFFRNVGF